MNETTTDTRDVHIYSSGLCFCSVCAPADMLIPDMLRQVNLSNPTGLSHGWEVDNADKFSGGQPNPCACESDATRLHYLLSC